MLLCGDHVTSPQTRIRLTEADLDLGVYVLQMTTAVVAWHALIPCLTTGHLPRVQATKSMSANHAQAWKQPPQDILRPRGRR